MLRRLIRNEDDPGNHEGTLNQGVGHKQSDPPGKSGARRVHIRRHGRSTGFSGSGGLGSPHRSGEVPVSFPLCASAPRRENLLLSDEPARPTSWRWPSDRRAPIGRRGRDRNRDRALPPLALRFFRGLRSVEAKAPWQSSSRFAGPHDGACGSGVRRIPIRPSTHFPGLIPVEACIPPPSPSTK